MSDRDTSEFIRENRLFDGARGQKCLRDQLLYDYGLSVMYSRHPGNKRLRVIGMTRILN